MIRVHQYQKVYRDVVAVEDLSFEVAGGSIAGLVGPNGAGKTTTLRALAGIIPPTRGKLSICDFDVVEQPVEAKLRLALIPDDPKLFDSLTVWEHLEFIASAYNVPEHVAKAEALLERFALVDKRNTLAQELSRGMRQKVAICCGYLHDPQVVLLDEPMTGLDPHAIRTFKESVIEVAEQGAAVIISSHLLNEVEDMCSELLILVKGQLLFGGGIDEAREQFGALDRDATLEDVFFKATEH